MIWMLSASSWGVDYKYALYRVELSGELRTFGYFESAEDCYRWAREREFFWDGHCMPIEQYREWVKASKDEE